MCSGRPLLQPLGDMQGVSSLAPQSPPARGQHLLGSRPPSNFRRSTPGRVRTAALRASAPSHSWLHTPCQRRRARMQVAADAVAQLDLRPACCNAPDHVPELASFPSSVNRAPDRDLRGTPRWLAGTDFSRRHAYREKRSCRASPLPAACIAISAVSAMNLRWRWECR